MKEVEFVSQRTGKLFWEPNGAFYRFEPSFLPFKNPPSGNELTDALFRTALVLGRLDELTREMSPEEVALLKAPFILKEATLSSEIEGTRSTLADVYRDEKQKSKDERKKQDNEEIRNYAAALEHGLKNMGDEISEDLIKEIHRILLEGVRGYRKNPGEYKTVQNAIGSHRDTLETAKFVPASPGKTPALMKNFVDYANSHSKTNSLYKLATLHYQFEAIHPFRDGNGRLGRLLIILSLRREGVLHQPLLYVSEFFNRNRDSYTDLLYRASSEGDLEGWTLFFLKALETQAEQSLQLIRELGEYKATLLSSIEDVSRSQNLYRLVELIFRNPYIKITEVSETLDMSVAGASGLVHKLEDGGVLKEITGKKSNKLFVAHKILHLLIQSQSRPRPSGR